MGARKGGRQARKKLESDMGGAEGEVFEDGVLATAVGCASFGILRPGASHGKAC